MSKRVYFLAHGGVVQGVGFRYFVQKKAVEYHVTGWVRNTDDNKVEGEAQGNADSVSQFLKHVDDGPRHAHVVRLDKKDLDIIDGEDRFQVRH
ncbi:Acylphosphatase [Phialemonium atrogriseum]|uniref:acylphosphatase n=1 Tax=Phialemonium atrogriseum TaxID=1093897 RepID=A0AAJ0BUP8_9PEZI|nr:Acylphosphatase [Phialemonium atrogriseum]KAK1764596.1 Acylphosphatase [Phialemonium atrogriseum]